MTTGERIKIARKSRGLTQKELAEKIGFSTVCVAQWENNSRTPKWDALLKVATALELDACDLMGDAELNDFSKLYGNYDDRVASAFHDLDIIIENEIHKLGHSGQHVTISKLRHAIADDVSRLATAHRVRKKDLYHVLDGYSSYPQFDSDDIIDTTDETLVSVIDIMQDLNADGRSAALRHLNELKQIPAYRKTEC